MAADRVMASVAGWLERKLRLKVSATKTKVVRPTKSNFLGFTFWKVTYSTLGLYRRRAGDVMNYTLSPKILGLKTKDRPGLVDPLAYYLARCT